MDRATGITSRARTLGKRLVLRANHALGNYRDAVWLIGDGRSGTTWVSDLINHDRGYREMFEPFHPQLAQGAGTFTPHLYVRGGEMNDELRNLARTILSGRLCDQRVDVANKAFFYRGLLVKDIFANLMCHAVCRELDWVKPVLLIRNPFAVAQSKARKKDWYWASEPMDLLKQPALYEDFLAPYEDLIRRTSARSDLLLNHILIWSIINTVPLRQFAPQDIYVSFYESIYAEPNREVSRLFGFLQGQPDYRIELDQALINRPSRVVRNETSLASGSSPVTSWKDDIEPRLIDEGLSILEQFGLASLYDEDGMPDKRVLASLQSPA
ncbi:sulfotransferase domain-containing protein [Marinobacter bohaiensis]|uniref:sulfotransferase domain-containing protein n=1 Tax=Marinobacter bohaiensis TaxID=2201898 RepID=UPI000DACF0A9|nr:sulfotransferase domain-containing protein [Marinobacter bohaiensis]